MISMSVWISLNKESLYRKKSIKGFTFVIWVLILSNPGRTNVRIRLVFISEQSEAAKHFSLTLYERVSLALWKF
jgi:hypothetical protein